MKPLTEPAFGSGSPSLGTLRSAVTLWFMPRFFFDVSENGDVTCDGDGFEFRTVEAAAREATDAATEIAHDLRLKEMPTTVAVDVLNSDRQALFTVEVTMRIVRTAST